MVDKLYKCVLIIGITISSLYGQAPSIPIVQSINPKSATVDEIVEITGNNFGTIKNAIQVYFGAARASVQKVEDNLITVLVPAGATYSPITVINTSTGLSATSRSRFLLSFGGQNLSAGNFSIQSNFQGDPGLNDHCIGDFDLDGKADVAMANLQTNSISILRNISTLTTIDFNPKENFDMGAPTSNITSADIDGDGKLDLIVSKYPTGVSIGDKVYVMRNTSIVTPGSEDINFAPHIEFSVEGGNAKNIVVEDLDGDGKPEVVVSNEANNIISILKNESTPGSVSFNTNIIKAIVANTDKCSGVALSDLNGDKKPELIVTTYVGSNIFILQNVSSPGNVSFGNSQVIYVSGNIANVAVGDLNGDTKPDIAVTKILSENISVVTNKTVDVGGAPVFSSTSKEFKTAPQPWGIDIGDADGDGKPDILVTSVFNGNLVSVLQNISVSDDINFAPKIDLSTVEPSRSIRLVDINGDGKPDLTFTSITSNKLSVIRNKHCVLAQIFSKESLIMCPGQTITLFAPKGRGITYQWKKNGVNITTGNQSSYKITTLTAPEEYKVVISGEVTTCITESNPVTISPGTGTIPPISVATNTGPVCEGGNITLKATAISGATYSWSGPNNFSSTEQNPVLTDVDYSKTGNYYLKVTIGSCTSKYDTTAVLLNTASPSTAIIASSLAICDNASSTLQISDTPGNTYQWYKDGNAITGAQSFTYTASSGGNYSIHVLTGAGCSATSKEITIKKIEAINPDFTLPPAGCTNTVITLTNKTAGIDQYTNVKYLWDFGNGVTTTEKEPLLKRPKYSAPGTFTVKLKITVEDLCWAEIEKRITIGNNFTIPITSSNAANKFCEGDGLTLTAPEGYANYKWKRGTEVITESTLSSISVNRPGKYTLEVSKDGCSGAGTITLESASKPVVTAKIISDTNLATPGDSVELSAEGAEFYQWSPAEGISNPNIANPKVLPKWATTYTVIGKNTQGCADSAEVIVGVSSEILVTPTNVITPNGDTKNETWIIKNIENYKTCKVVIINRQGQKVFEAMPYNNDWDGTSNGKKLPEGSYYYIIQCTELGAGKTGSLTLVR